MKLATRLTLLGALAATLPSDLIEGSYTTEPQACNGRQQLGECHLINAGKERLFKPGSILDTIPVHKAQVFLEGKLFTIQAMHTNHWSSKASLPC